MNLTYREMHDQYAALERTLAHLSANAQRIERCFEEAHPRAVVCIGCGSSYMLAQSVAELAGLHLGMPCYAMAAGDLMLNAERRHKQLDGALLIALSRSGSTSEVLEAVKAVRDRCDATVISVICAEDRPLKAVSDLTLELPWAFDHSVCQTRSVTNLYVAGMGIVSCIAELGLDAEFLRAAQIGPAFLRKHEPNLRDMAAQGWESVVVLADDTISGLAQEGALAFIEICRVPSNWYHVLDARHGPMTLIDKRTLVIAMMGGPVGAHERHLIGMCASRGARVVVVSRDALDMAGVYDAPVGDLPREAAGVLAVGVCQMLAVYRAQANGSNPDAPEGLDAWVAL